MRLRHAALFGALLLAGIAYTIYWFNQAGDVREGIAVWAGQRRAEGYIVEYTALDISGYPLRLQSEARDVRLAGRYGDTDWEWRTKRLTGNVLPYSLKHIVLRAPEPQEISLKNVNDGVLKKYFIAPDLAMASLVLDSGSVSRLAVDFSGGEIHGDAIKGKITLGRVQLHARQGNDRIENPPLLELAVEIENTAYAGFSGSALGENLTLMSVNMGVEGAQPAASGAAGIHEWRDAGGIVQVQEFRIDWGPLQLSAAGTTALDAEDRLIGSLTARLHKYEGLISALHAAGQLSDEEQAAASLALGLITTAAGNENGELSLPLVLQDGEMYLGPVRIAKLQPLF